jgi:hypothetical protein
MARRRGRKRLSGARHPGGELVRVKVDYRALAAQQPHRRWLPEPVRLDQKADTPFGALNLINVITDAQYEAGQRYAYIVGQYRASIGTPSIMSGSGKGYPCAPEICRRPPPGAAIECECRKRKERYDAAVAAVFEAGQKAARAVARVAVHGEPCPRGGLADLKRGLSALVKHFGLR